MALSGEVDVHWWPLEFRVSLARRWRTEGGMMALGIGREIPIAVRGNFALSVRDYAR